MKKIFFASGLLALMASTTSCDKYDIYPEEFDGVFSIKDSGTRELTVYSTDVTAEVPFVVMKGGYDPAHNSSATLKVMNDTEFAEYQESSGNSYTVRVGSECYSFSPSATENIYSVDMSFDSEDKRYEVHTLYIRPSVLKTWMDQNAASIGERTPVIPVTLVSEQDTVSSYANVTLVSLDLQTPSLTADVNGVVARTINRSTLLSEGNNFYKPEANFSIPCDNPWGFKLHVHADDQAITDYNAANGTNYIPLDPSAYTLQTEYHFTAGTTYLPLNLSIDLDKLNLLNLYAIAVKVDHDNPITWDDAQNNPGDALGIDNEMTLIFTVRVIDVVTLNKIQLSTANVKTNDQEPSEGPLSDLFDGNTSTFFHSGWSVANPRESVYASYLQIELPEQMSMFRFNLTNRNSPTAAGYVKTVYLYGSNDPDNWPTVPFAKIENMTDQLYEAVAVGSFGTDEQPYLSESSIRYLRFCVMESGGGSLGTTTGAIYWCASELELYGY